VPLLHEVVEGEAAVLVARGNGDDEAVVGGDEGGAAGTAGGAAGTAGGEGVLVEGPAVEGAGHGRRVVEHGAEGGGGHGRDLRGGEGQAWEEGGEDGAGGGAGIDTGGGAGIDTGRGGQLLAQACGEMALGEQTGAPAGADRAGEVALLGGGEPGVGGSGVREQRCPRATGSSGVLL